VKKSRGFGFGIIGCGMIANFHARAIGDIRGAKVVACYDTLPAAADRFAAAQGCRAYHHLEAMLADEDIDIVTVGTPSGAHLEPALAAARAGKHVIVEKPLEITLRRCDKIIAECDRAGVKLSAIFPSRFHRASVELKKAVVDGRFGQLTLGEAYVKWFRTQAYYDSGAWRGTWELDGGGALMNQAIHSVDILTWLMGPVSEITAHWGLLAHNCDFPMAHWACWKRAPRSIPVISSASRCTALREAPRWKKKMSSPGISPKKPAAMRRSTPA
jgi:predicted dehydrogenase